ncbi:MAG: glycosyltransferase family 1 protein [Sphingobium sp.]|nr:MAG: glycosyltransferase family 1 protein [Sphingobium sp.]
MADRSVLLSSNYNAWPEVFNGQCFAFLNVVDGVEDAQMLVPPGAPYTAGRAVRPNFRYLFGELLHRSHSQLRRKFGQPAASNMQEVTVDRDHDLFMFMCQFPVELAAINRLKGWRERSRTAVAFILESWSHTHEAAKSELALLNQFDHVFVLNRECIPNLRKYVTVPISFLATATDCLMASPFPGNPDRSIDVFSMGRRSAVIHDKLVALSGQGDNGFMYVHDTSKGGTITNWYEHRLMSANMIKRSKYFIAFNHTVIDPSSESKNFQEQALATRYFEGAAGGSIVLGSRAGCREFDECFDWDDAVIDLPEDVADLGAFLADLDGQTDRIARARIAGVANCLRRHDWGHRWGQILDTLGLERPLALQDRLEMLASLADMAERSIEGGALARGQRAAG